MRKIIHIFLSLVIVYAGTVSAYAATSTGGWTATDTIIAGANTTIEAVRTAGGKTLKSAVTVGASATKVGKHLIKGGGQAALAYAVVELIGEGIDWVLDPANNRIKYKFPAGGGNPDGWIYTYKDILYYSANDACNAMKATNSDWAAYECWKSSLGQYNGVLNIGKDYGGRPSDYASYSKAPAGGGNPADEYKYIPIETVAAKVISNAEAGHGPSQDAVKAAALEGFAAGEHDAALESAAVESDAGTDNPTDPNNPADPADPAAPFDPSSIIGAINALKALLAGILSSITNLTDFFNSEPPPEKTQKETDVPVEVPPEVKNATEFDVDYIGFSSQCPTLSPFSVGIGGASSSMTFDMTPLCNLAVTIRPAIIAIAYFIGLGVIASAIRET